MPTTFHLEDEYALSPGAVGPMTKNHARRAMSKFNKPRGKAVGQNQDWAVMINPLDVAAASSTPESELEAICEAVS